MITAIIVNYHTARMLPPLLNVLEQEPLVVSVIVADNSRESGLAESLTTFKKTRLLIFDTNIGFGAAVNRAATFSESLYWLLLNPDIRLNGNTIPSLTKAAEAHGSILTGPRYYWDEGRKFRFPPASGYCLWFRAGDQAASRFAPDAELVSFQTEALFHRHWEATEPFTEPFLSGACVLIRRDETHFPGGRIFDERFFMYFEDTDLCVRMMLQGELPLCVPAATAVHYWDQSPSERKTEMVFTSEQQFLQKYYDDVPPGWTSPAKAPDEICDLGSFSEPPLFKRREKQTEGPLFIDFGVNHFFRPFARADFSGKTFEFPAEIWSRLANGCYYSRVLSSGLRQNRAIYRWRKE